MTKKKFPWPSLTDGLFKNTEDFRYNTVLGIPFRHDWGIYSDGYMTACENLLGSLVRKRNPRNRDALVYPILFLFHHHLELRFKNIILKGGHIIGLPETFPEGHDLTALWPNTKKIVLKLNATADSTPLNAVDRIMRELMKISRSSEGYRYPVTIRGERTILGNEVINLKNLKKVVSNVNAFVDAVTMQVEDVHDMKMEYEHAMESEMRASMERY